VPTNITASSKTKTKTTTINVVSPEPVIDSSPTFYLVAPLEYTTNSCGNDTERASAYYRKALNEDSAEVWLHRGFARMMTPHRQTMDPHKADVILIAGYFHLNRALHQPKRKKNHNESPMTHLQPLLTTYQHHLSDLYKIDPTIRNRPHLLLIPTWNPSLATEIGLKAFVTTLESELRVSNLWSVGFERNPFWQGGIPAERIVPIPYVVVRPTIDVDDDSLSMGHHDGLVALPNTKQSNFVFYAGDPRRNAKAWSGCHRDRMILPLQQNQTMTNRTMIDVRLVTKANRMDEVEYTRRMTTSDYCLILCGDTPTSRTLTSAMISGCIPIFVGSRWRGLCRPPCQRRFGWKVTGAEYPHWPYPQIIPWTNFPELDEERFMENGRRELLQLFERVDQHQKSMLRSAMNSSIHGWIYGWGDPLTSDKFGGATEYIWQSFLASFHAAAQDITGTK
jgi:hypothetical protein